MLLARMIKANFAEIDAAIAVRHLKTSDLLLFSADAWPSTWSRKSCAAELDCHKSIKEGILSIRGPQTCGKRVWGLCTPGLVATCRYAMQGTAVHAGCYTI